MTVNLPCNELSLVLVQSINRISLIVRLMSMRIFFRWFMVLSVDAAKGWHWNLRDGKLTSDVYGLLQLANMPMTGGCRTKLCDGEKSRLPSISHAPEPQHDHRNRRQCQPRMKEFHDAILPAAHLNVYIRSISCRLAVLQAESISTKVRDNVLFCMYGLHHAYCQLFFNNLIIFEMTMGHVEIKIYSLCCIYRADNWITHLLAALVVAEVGDGLTVDRWFACAGHSDRDIAACSLSQTFCRGIIEIYDDWATIEWGKQVFTKKLAYAHRKLWWSCVRPRRFGALGFPESPFGWVTVGGIDRWSLWGDTSTGV